MFLFISLFPCSPWQRWVSCLLLTWVNVKTAAHRRPCNGDFSACRVLPSSPITSLLFHASQLEDHYTTWNPSISFFSFPLFHVSLGTSGWHCEGSGQDVVSEVSSWCLSLSFCLCKGCLMGWEDRALLSYGEMNEGTDLSSLLFCFCFATQSNSGSWTVRLRSWYAQVPCSNFQFVLLAESWVVQCCWGILLPSSLGNQNQKHCSFCMSLLGHFALWSCQVDRLWGMYFSLSSGRWNIGDCFKLNLMELCY